MYEHQLMAFHAGVRDVELTFDNDATDTDSTNDSQSGRYSDLPYDAAAVSLTVTFAVTTDSEAWITVYGDGDIVPAFGGTGTLAHELIPYVFVATTLGSLLFAHNVSWNYEALFSPDMS